MINSKRKDGSDGRGKEVENQQLRKLDLLTLAPKLQRMLFQTIKKYWIWLQPLAEVPL